MRKIEVQPMLRGCWQVIAAVVVYVAGGAWAEEPQKSEVATISVSPAVSHELWDEVLKAHVDERGLVDYAAVGKSEAFRQYLDWLAKTDPAALPSNDDRLAFWINAYNARVIRGVLDLLPEDRSKWSEFKVTEAKSKDGVAFFKIRGHTVGGHEFHLDELEKCILWHDKKYTFQQPREASFYKDIGIEKPDIRAHFALVCAALSCPKLQRDAYVGPRVREQLISATREFVSDPKQVTVRPSQQLISVSKVFTWYYFQFNSPDYEGTKRTLNVFLADYMNDPKMAQALGGGSWRIKHDKAYDWRLNLQK